MNKIMIITGTRKGIGRYLAGYYIKKDFIVIGCSRANTDIQHRNYEHFCLDISDEKAVKKMFSQVYKKHKRLDFLINNAAIASMNHSFLTPLSTVERVFKTNFFGTFLFCREAGKIMAKNKFGRIVNFTTVAVPLNLEGEAVYAASKSAVESLTKILSKEFASYGITCNAIGPSLVKTDLLKNIPEEKIKELLDRITINKFGNFKDISNLIDFYISEQSGMLTGQIIYLGGIK